MERMPKPGECYRHFKNNMYQILTVATHTETGEPMVVYQALYGDFGTYVRPLDMFTSEVEHEKYPEISQRYRFEKISDIGMLAAHGGAVPEQEICTEEVYGKVPVPIPQEPNFYLVRFLDAGSHEERMQLLREMRGHIRQKDLDSLCVALDVKPTEGTLEEQVEAVERYLMMQEHYDGTHLR